VVNDGLSQSQINIFTSTKLILYILIS
jgi:hypothetical protein